LGIGNYVKGMNSGFFSIKDTESKSRPDGKVYSCAACGLYKDCKNPKLKPVGNFKKEILIIANSPTSMDDHIGKPLRDMVGKLLKETLQDFNIDLLEDCLYTYAVQCMCKDANDNTIEAKVKNVASCRNKVLKLIEDIQPRLILTLGSAATASLIEHRWKSDFGAAENQPPIEKWRGWQIPDQDIKAWICPVYSPLMILEAKNKDSQTIWVNDIKKALSLLDKKFYRFKTPKIDIVEDLSFLRQLTNEVAIDYETTGLKPHAKEHKIVTISVSDTPDHSYVFELNTQKKINQWIRFIADSRIQKICQNMKYEDNWSAVLLGQSIEGLCWDTMLAAHQLDNRKGITGLKFQMYVRFGVIDYSSEIKPYLESKSKDGNAFNRIEELMNTKEGRFKLMTYNGMDTIATFRLANLQRELLNYSYVGGLL
jgi:uracil-DNA glycosylase family 4